MVLEQSDEIGFHWDKDYSVEGQGVNVFPHLATVTYLSDVGRRVFLLPSMRCHKCDFTCCSALFVAAARRWCSNM
eukprot:SAG31_NODE_126_length_23665_cov_6.178987_27_plen_75_part_00